MPNQLVLISIENKKKTILAFLNKVITPQFLKYDEIPIALKTVLFVDTYLHPFIICTNEIEALYE